MNIETKELVGYRLGVLRTFGAYRVPIDAWDVTCSQFEGFSDNIKDLFPLEDGLMSVFKREKSYISTYYCSDGPILEVQESLFRGVFLVEDLIRDYNNLMKYRDYINSMDALDLMYKIYNVVCDTIHIEKDNSSYSFDDIIDYMNYLIEIVIPFGVVTNDVLSEIYEAIRKVIPNVRVFVDRQNRSGYTRLTVYVY